MRFNEDYVSQFYTILRSEFLERTGSQVERVAELSVGKVMKHVDFWMLAIKPPQLKNTEEGYDFSENGKEANTIDKIRVLTFRKQLIKDAWEWIGKEAGEQKVSAEEILNHLCEADPENKYQQTLTVKFKIFLVGEEALIKPNHLWRHFSYIAQAVREFKDEKLEHEFMQFSIKVTDELMSRIGFEVYKRLIMVMGEDKAREFLELESLDALMVLSSENMLKYLERLEVGKFYPQVMTHPDLGEKRKGYKAGEGLMYEDQNYNTKSIITTLNENNEPEITLAQKEFRGLNYWTLPGGFSRKKEIEEYEPKIGFRETVFRETMAEVLKMNPNDMAFESVRLSFLSAKKVYQGDVMDPREDNFTSSTSPGEKRESIVHEAYFPADSSGFGEIPLRSEGLETADVEHIFNARKISIFDIYKKGYIHKMYGSQAGIIDGFCRKELERYYSKNEKEREKSIFRKMPEKKVEVIKGILIGRGVWKD